MKYVLVQNNETVILGPVFWNFRMFQSELRDEFDLEVSIPQSNEGVYKINDEFSIIPVEESFPSHNTKIEQLAGPFYTFTDTLATASYTVVPKSIESVKSELKTIVASNRYGKEVAGTKVTIQGKEVSVSTTRGDRDIFLQALQLGADGKNWKFDEGFFVLSIVELQSIVGAIVGAVQGAFDWEASKISEIDSAESLEVLDAINLSE
jgi:hypothetical protein